MKRISLLLIPLFLSLLTACTRGVETPNQIETIVASALTQTAAPATLTPIPVPSTLPVISTAQKIYTSSLLGIQFSYPDNWVLQEFTEDQPATVILTSFNPANPPHKLEWTDQTISVQFRLLPSSTVPQNFDAWVDAAKQTAAANQLTLFAEERFLIANQQAARLTLVSGSGGIIHQILVILNEHNYEMDIEGNLDLGKSVLDTVQVFSSGGLKPSEGDTPAAGICFETQDEHISIVLGLDQSGMPLAGRCIALAPMQRIKLINQSGGPFAIKFADYSIDLPVGNELLLDRPVGEYLAPGAHFLPMGPTLWVRAAEAVVTPVAAMPGPLRNYSNPEVGYTLTLPPGWNVDEYGLVNPNKEVIFYPNDAEPFLAYLSISLDPRTLEQITDLYAQSVADAVREDAIFDGHQAVKFTYPYGRQEYYIPYIDRIILIVTDKPTDGNVQLMLMSVTFAAATFTRYTNDELGYSLHLPVGWVVDENGLTAMSREVRIYPVNPEPFIAYLDIGLDPRSLEALKAQDLPDAQKTEIFYAGQTGVQYIYSSGRSEIYLLYRGQVYYLISDKPDDENIQKMIASFVFVDG